MFVYAGTYTEPDLGKAEGIYVFDFDVQKGALKLVQVVTGAPNPSFLALGKQQRFLYAVNELTEGRVSAFSRDPETGELTFLNSQDSHGSDPCHLSLDQAESHVLVANYTSGSVAALPIAEDGSLRAARSSVQHEGSSVNPRRQAGPHAHMIAPVPDGKAVLVTDLGTDEVVIYRLVEAMGRLEREGAFALDPGSGPRHFAFSANGRFLYVLDELDSSVNVFEYESEQLAFPHRQTISTLPRYFDDRNDCAQVVVSPDCRFVYASNRGHDSIAIFAVDGATGELSMVDIVATGGKEPRNFAMDPSGKWLLAANQKSDTIVTFARDPQTGLLTQHGEPVPVPSPVCLVFAGS